MNSCTPQVAIRRGGLVREWITLPSRWRRINEFSYHTLDGLPDKGIREIYYLSTAVKFIQSLIARRMEKYE